jgi:hypothetical protein
MNLSMFSARETATDDAGGAAPEQARLNVALDYARNSRRQALQFSAVSVVPYAGGVAEGNVSYLGGVNYAVHLGRRMQLQVSQSVSQQPLGISAITGSGAGAAAGQPSPLTAGGFLAVRETRHDGSFTLSRILNPRTSARFSFAHTSSVIPGRSDANSRLLSVSVERRMSAATRLHAGYGIGEATFATTDSEAGVRHDVDLGIAFARPLPFSRQTMLDVGTGTALVTDGLRHRVRFVASGSLSRPVGRWSSRLDYSRPMQFVAGFRQPFFSDAVGVTADGPIGRGWSLLLASGAARGSAGMGAGSRNYRSHSLSVRVDRQIAPTLRFVAEGFATSFVFAGGSTAGPLPPRLERRGVRVGLSWTAPLLRK